MEKTEENLQLKNYIFLELEYIRFDNGVDDGGHR